MSEPDKPFELGQTYQIKIGAVSPSNEEGPARWWSFRGPDGKLYGIEPVPSLPPAQKEYRDKDGSYVMEF